MTSISIVSKAHDLRWFRTHGLISHLKSFPFFGIFPPLFYLFLVATQHAKKALHTQSIVRMKELILFFHSYKLNTSQNRLNMTSINWKPMQDCRLQQRNKQMAYNSTCFQRYNILTKKPVLVAQSVASRFFYRNLDLITFLMEMSRDAV